MVKCKDLRHCFKYIVNNNRTSNIWLHIDNSNTAVLLTHLIPKSHFIKYRKNVICV